MGITGVMNGPEIGKSKPTDKKKDPGPPLKILLADDTAVNLLMASKLLKGGHDITMRVLMVSKIFPA